MFKKFHKEYNTLTDSESENIDENILKGAENLLINVIGAVNVKRWSALKIVYSCKTDEEFVTKLLDIAQEYLNRKAIGNENTNLVSVKSSKELKTNTKSKVAPIHKQYTEEKNKKRNKYVECSNVRIKNKTILTKCNNIQKTKTENKIMRMNEKVPKEDLKNQTTEVDQSNIEKNSSPDDADKCKVNDSQPVILKLESESSNTIPNNLDVIRIKLCYFCNTHHIQDHCPINLPQSIINDTLDHDSWIQKYKQFYENGRKKVKSENKNENIFEDILKYSYAIMSLPEFLCIGETNCSHGLGVFVKKTVESFTQFGPLVGTDVKEMDISEDIDMKYLWEVNVEKRNIYINTENAETSNWIRFIRPAPKREDKNISVICKQDKLYFITVKQITVGDELLYWQDCPNTMNKKKMEKTTCGGCNMGFSHPQYYRVHCSVFHDVRYSLTIKKYHCKICGEAVLGKENIVKHAAELHNGQGAYQCQFCKKFFLRLNYLEMHRTYGCSANPHRSRPLCDFCGRKFCQPQKLKVHIKRMHSDFSEVLKEFQCKSCLKILGSRAALQRHAKEVHQKQTEGQCSCIRCGKRFQNKSNLKIHMLTHSGIKPFRCTVTGCNAAFTTKQCLQFHYKKVHNFTEENMPKIERSIDYTFQAYSGGENDNKNNTESLDTSKSESNANQDDRNSDTDNDSLDSQSIDDPLPMQQSPPPPITDLQTTPPSPQEDYHKTSTLGTNIKVLSKGSKKWIADEPSASKIPDIYSIERLSKDDLQISLQETDIYDRTNFTRHEASNASLLVEAALDSVCNEPNIDIDVNTSQNCTDTLVNNLYTLTQPDNLPDVSYGEAACINDSRDINLISPSVNDHISVTDELNDELSHNGNIGMHYSNFAHNNFSPPHTPDVHRSNFVRNYINSLSPQNTNYSQKNTSPVPSPPRYDFGHNVNTDNLSSDDSNGMAVQNLSLNNSKNDIQLDLSIYKSPYKSANNDYIRKFNFESKNDPLDHEHIDVISQGDVASSNNQMESEMKESTDSQNQPKFPDELSSDIRNKFDIDLDIRLKNYDNIDGDSLRLRNHTYENNELDFRNKAYDLLDVVENRNKQYDLDSDFRADRNFEPLMLNSSELQGLDMSARGFHSYTNINRYHHLYPDMDRVDIRLNYSPPPPTYTHADILRVVSLDLTPPGRHSVDLSLRNHSLHQIANSRLLTDHGLQTNHRLLDQTRLLTTDLTSTRHLSTDRIISEASTRILTDHTTSRILNDPISTNHLLNTDQNRLLGDESRLLDQGRLIGDGRILPTVTPSGAISPVQGFGGYSVSQNPYHPTPIAPRPHVTSPTPTPYHYPTYY